MAGMRVKTIREAFPPIIAFIGGLVILADTVFTEYKGKMPLKGGGEIYRATDRKEFRLWQNVSYVIAALFLAYWIFEILTDTMG